MTGNAGPDYWHATASELAQGIAYMDRLLSERDAEIRTLVGLLRASMTDEQISLHRTEARKAARAENDGAP